MLYSDCAELCETIAEELYLAPCFDDKNGVYYLHENLETCEIGAYDLPTFKNIRLCHNIVDRSKVLPKKKILIKVPITAL